MYSVVVIVTQHKLMSQEMAETKECEIKAQYKETILIFMKMLLQFLDVINT